MQYDCKIFDQPNGKVVGSSQVTEHYTQIVAPAGQEKYDQHEPARLVLFDQDDSNVTEHSIVLAIAIARYQENAMNFVADYIGLSVKDQKFEMSHIDLGGQNGTYLFIYVCEDAPGWSVAYGMNTLARGGYDLQAVIDEYMLP